MSNLENQPVDIEEQRKWLRDHKSATGMSGKELEKRIGRSWGTLSQFTGEKGYAGDEQGVAEQVHQYRQLLASQTLYKLDLPEAPKFFAGPTAQEILSCITFAHSYRRQVAIGTGAGMGKTTVFEHYQETYPNVFLATMDPTTSGVNNMLIAVLKALGVAEPKGSPYRLGVQIVDKLRDSGGLLIIDETQHLSVQAIEQIRSLYDQLAKGSGRPDFGLVFAGNLSMMQRLEGDARGAEYAQIFSRIGFKMLRPNGVNGDADAMCAAWGISDEKIIAAIRDIVTKPGALRQATYVLELAYLMAAGEGGPLNSGHVRESWGQLSMRKVAA